jgi:hypothetical protein
VRHELDGDVDIVAISPDGLAGIIYQDEGWYALIDLVDPGSPATRLLPDADQDLTFAFVRRLKCRACRRWSTLILIVRQLCQDIR